MGSLADDNARPCARGYNCPMPETSFPRRNFLRGVTAATALSYAAVRRQ